MQWELSVHAKVMHGLIVHSALGSYLITTTVNFPRLLWNTMAPSTSGACTCVLPALLRTNLKVGLLPIVPNLGSGNTNAYFQEYSRTFSGSSGMHPNVSLNIHDGYPLDARLFSNPEGQMITPPAVIPVSSIGAYLAVPIGALPRFSPTETSCIAGKSFPGTVPPVYP